MRFARTILAFALALSVAMLPAAGSAVPGADMARSAAATTSEHAAMMDHGCPDQATPCDQGDGCRSMACCASQSPGMAGAAVSAFVYPPLPEQPLPALADRAVAPHAGSPPFRPPRI